MNLPRCLERLEEAAAAAAGLGIDTSAAAAVRANAKARAGFPSSVYVLALAGGTGVGKSTLLNALAGEEVSPASARRPTTAEPLAWVPADKRGELAELIAWLGVSHVKEHRATSLAELAVLDLPDFDSIAPEHRARVDALLPRVDAVAWVVDPEKYKDDLVHAAYLGTWGPRLGRQVVVLNRSDILAADEVARVREDMRAQLRRERLGDTEVAVARAREGARGVEEVRRWLDAGVEAKRVIAARLGAEAREAVRDLARRAGVSEGKAAPLVDPARRDRAIGDVVRGVLGLVDVRGLEHQAVAATRLGARRRGAGPLGALTSAIYRLSGRARVAADPAGYLRRWRTRGSLAPATEPLRELFAGALAAVPVALRGSVAALGTPATVEARLADAVDRALEAEAAGFRAPTSLLWSAIGLGQYVVTALLVFAGLWFLALFLLPKPISGWADLPVVGPVPSPVVLLAAVLLAGYLLALVLRSHAGWLGRRWARQIAALVTREVHARVHELVLLPLEQLESAREQLARAARDIDEDCA